MDDRKIQIFLDTLLPLLKAGVAFTIPLALLSFVLGLILAILTALARLSPWVIPKLIARFYVWVIRGTPLLVQLFIIFYGLPAVGIVLDPFIAATIGFTLSVGAYSSEIVRAAILSIHKSTMGSCLLSRDDSWAGSAPRNSATSCARFCTAVIQFLY